MFKTRGFYEKIYAKYGLDEFIKKYNKIELGVHTQ